MGHVHDLKSTQSYLRQVVILALGTLLLTTQCASPTPQMTEELSETGYLKMRPSTNVPIESGQEVNLWIDYADWESPDYVWRISNNGRLIKEEQGLRSFSFKAPDQPGSYMISLEVTDGSKTFRPTPISIIVVAPSSPTITPMPTLTYTSTPVVTSTPTETPALRATLTATPALTATPIPTPTLTPSPTLTATPKPPADTPTPTATLIPTPYPIPVLTGPDNNSQVLGEFPPLYWTWDGQLGEDEFYEVRIWHESITTYHPALGWVKVPQFDYNVKGERSGKYYWTVLVVKGTNAKRKEWTLQPWWPYPMWEGTLVAPLSPESEPRFFLFECNGPCSGSDISNPQPEPTPKEP